MYAVRSPYESVAMAAVKHPNFGNNDSDMRSALKHSYHKSVAKEAIEHSRFGSSPQHIEAALDSPFEFVRELAKQKQNTQSTPKPSNEVKESTTIKSKKFSALLENIGSILRHKKYLTESEKLFPGNKIWFSKKTGIVPIDDLNDLGMHHSNFVVHEPGKFGYTDDDVEKMVGPKHYGQLVQKSNPWSDRLITKMNDHGHFRGFYRYKKSTNPESDNSEHQFDMYDDRSWIQSDLIKRATGVSDTLDPFHEHFTHVLNAVPKGQELRLKVETGLPISSELQEKLTTKHGAIVHGGDTMSTSVKFPNRQSLESYVNDTQAKRSRELPEAPREVTSSDINAALGQRPQSMMPAEWNFFRRIGDSYEAINDKLFLLESEGIYDAMRDSIENRLRDEHRKKHESGLIPEPTLKKEHIKQYGLHHSLLEPVSGRSRIDYADFDYIKKSRDNQDQEATRRVYKFYIPKEGSPTAPHHVAVTIGTRSDHDLIDPRSMPDMKDVSFSIDGFESARILPEMAFEKHRAVYSGVMDAISHHHFDTGTYDFNYNFTPTAITRQEERAKGRRYKKMAQILRKSI